MVSQRSVLPVPGDAGQSPPAAAPIRIGISACLLGSNVRFDGGHKRNRFVTETLAAHFEFVSFCPEVAIGMGIPRQPVRLVGDARAPAAVGVKNPELNVTRPLQDYGRKVAGNIADLSGFIFKKDSPSCGMARVKLYNDKGMAERAATGLFAREIMAARPLLPVEEEGRLNDAELRESFITRVYVYARWQALMNAGVTRAALLRFHASHKLLLLACSTVAYRELGRLLAGLDGKKLDELADTYITRLMRALVKPATRKRHTNVLQHLLGYLKKDLDAAQRADLAETIDAYRRGLYPLVVPIRLLQHHFSRHPHPYIDRQVYLEPHPRALMLRNSL
ncbi:MAG: DUF523 and DUF1722 domain-containing protein [Gammaproteobacteria bacterium]|jgi:uncharacterized protein YbgA (DUF1722 family)/uncharacterized protein YbbK (DUF523 family)